jgi:hypothetical protein
MHDYLARTNDGEIELESIKFSGAGGHSSDADKVPIVFYHGRTPSFGDEDGVMVIGNDRTIADNYAGSN